MTSNHRPRRPWVALTAALVLTLAACAGDAPNSIFTNHTEFNRDVGALFNSLFFWGALVFVGVEAVLIYVIFKYRRREGQPEPRQVHGHTTLEILWTVIPALILVFIAIPTVRTIFRTQAKAVPHALQVEVIGHQWWWEFRYPQYGITTANELYLPTGRTVNFALRTADVLHSFWIPQLSGKRDLIANHTNYLWFTPDSVESNAWNGFCAEYCGTSHANMHFRMFTVSPEEFESWAAHQRTPAAFGAVAAVTQPQPSLAGTPAPASQPTAEHAAAAAAAGQQGGTPGATPATATTAAAPVSTGFRAFTAERMPAHTVPDTPVPAGMRYDTTLVGDPARGQQVYSRSACIGCHVIQGNPASVGIVGPSLTHIGSRTTIGAGLYPNDTRHLALWIKNARAMKPGALMPALGKGEIDPSTKQTVTVGGLSDQDVADIVAYLQALK